MTKIYRIPTGQVDGNGSNDNNTGEVRPYGEIGLFIGDNNKLELLMFDGIRTHVNSKVLNKGTFYGGDRDSADGNGYDTIKLVPDETLRRTGSQQYIIVEPTGGEPGHVHIRAGGTIDSSTADLFLGGEKNNVRVSDTNDRVVITADAGEDGTKIWTFDNDGRLTFPSGGAVESVGMGWTGLTNGTIGTPVSILFKTTAEGYAGQSIADITLTNSSATQGRVEVVTTDAVAATNKVWAFESDGTLVFPNSSVLDSADGNIEFRGMTNFNVEAEGNVSLLTDSQGDGKEWLFGSNGDLTVPGNSQIISATSAGFRLQSDYETPMVGGPLDGLIGGGVYVSAGQISVNYQQNDGMGESSMHQWDFNVYGTFDLASGGLRFDDNTTQTTAWTGGRVVTAPTHSTGAVGDQEGDLAFDDNYIYYCTADYGQVGHQITVATLYNGATSANTNSFQLTKTSDTEQITVGDTISDGDGGATSTVVSVSSDANYTYVGTGGMAYNANFPLTFTSTDPAYVSGGNIWKRIAWSAGTW